MGCYLPAIHSVPEDNVHIDGNQGSVAYINFGQFVKEKETSIVFQTSEQNIFILWKNRDRFFSYYNYSKNYVHNDFFFTDTTIERRLKAIEHLNDEYEIHHKHEKEQISALEIMIEGHPFRILTPFLFSKSNEDFSICEFPHHKQFISIVREAEKKAQGGEPAFYVWRGFRGFVSPNLPPITVPGLKVRLLNALQGIPDVSDAERKVKKKLI